MKDQSDVLVIGSGAGGGTLASWLAQHGVQVTVLEKGPHYRLEDFVDKDEIRAVRRTMFVPSVDAEPHLVKRGGATEFVRTTDGWIAVCVGGGTTHMGGFFFRLNSDDFAERSRLGAPEGSTVVDWPIAYADLEPYYERVETLLGVSGRHEPHPFLAPRRAGYPLPPLAEHPITAHLDRAIRAAGQTPLVTPRAILSAPYDGRSPCNYNGYCGSYGCETGARGSVVFTFIPKGLATGRMTLVPNAHVAEVTLAPDGRAQGAVYLDAEGVRHEVRARVVVVSCSAIESARLLLNSRSGRFPRGLANGSGLVGKNLSFSTFASVEADLHRDGGGKAIEGLFSPLPWLGRSVLDFYQRGPKCPIRKGGTIRFDLVHPNPIYRAEHVAKRTSPPLFGAPLKAALARHFREVRTVEAEIFAPFLPTARTWVDVDLGTTDRFGLPVAKIQVEHHPDDVAAARLLTDRARDVFTALGADDFRVPAPLGTTYVLQHGTCRFGTDPAASVLDPRCRAHEVPNLYVVDGSFMPTAGAVPTTLTIQANALRVAEHLREALLHDRL